MEQATVEYGDRMAAGKNKHSNHKGNQYVY